MSGKNELDTREKQEVTREDSAERTRTRRVYKPRADIYETEDALHLVADMAGVNEESVDITLEKNVLTVLGHAADQAPDGKEMIYREYAVGDYERSFVLSDEIDRKGIEAKISNGVLNLTLPKNSESKTRKIPVNGG